MSKKKTPAEYEQELFDREIMYFPIEPYIGAKIPIDHECVNGHVWKVAPTNVLNGKQCSLCKGKIPPTKWNHSSYSELLADRGVTLTEPFKNVSTQVTHKGLCGHTWRTTPNHLIQRPKSGCPYCASRGFRDKTKPCVMYFISFENEMQRYYKVGITTRTIEDRFAQEWYSLKMKLLWFKNFSSVDSAEKAEADFKYANKYCSVDTGLLKYGNTETFSQYIKEPVWN